MALAKNAAESRRFVIDIAAPPPGPIPPPPPPQGPHLPPLLRPAPLLRGGGGGVLVARRMVGASQRVCECVGECVCVVRQDVEVEPDAGIDPTSWKIMGFVHPPEALHPAHAAK